MGMILTGGFVLQVTSCASVSADMVAGATSSIANELIRTLVSEYFGVGGGMGGGF